MAGHNNTAGLNTVSELEKYFGFSFISQLSDTLGGVPTIDDSKFHFDIETEFIFIWTPKFNVILKN